MDVELLQQIANLPFNRYITILIALVVLPTISSTLIAYIKNKSQDKLINKIDRLCNKIDDLYESKFSEATIEQIIIAFESRAEIDVYSLHKKVRQMIHKNHIYEDKKNTIARILTLVTNTHNKSVNKLSCFEHNGIAIGDYFDETWINLNASTISDFIFKTKNDNNKIAYNYDLLLLRLKSNFETINNDFHNNISDT